MRRLSSYFLFVFFLLVLFFGQAISLYTDWLWFQEVGYTEIFTTTLTFKLLLALVFGGLFSLLLYFNIKLAAHAPRNIRFLEQENAIELPSPE
ncbi:MAG TPA: UPF0182 family protein, partial [Candidatus Binatia bacterium]|nr:UPF0182 family protein [Candidatus Binatia bacterium]